MKFLQLFFFTLLIIVMGLISIDNYRFNKIQISHANEQVKYISRAYNLKKQFSHVHLVKTTMLSRTGKVVHSVSMINLNNAGDLVAVWFSGSAESFPDVEIWESYYIRGNWTKPQVAVNKSNVQHYFVRTFGNPVLYRLDSELHMFVVESFGGWAVAKIGHFISYDNGKTWKEGALIFNSPFFDISTLVRNSPIVEKDRIIFPAYHESIRQYPELLILDRKFKVQDQIRVPSSVGLMQPAIIDNDMNIIGLTRNFSGVDDNALYKIQLSDNTFIKNKTNLQNFNSAIAITKLDNGQFLLVYNEGTDRSHLILAISLDLQNWQNIYDLENNKQQEEFSYPAISVINNLVHIMYTYKRTNIKHVVLQLE